ncbi:MAG: hypothetical protein P0116_10185 [Candidatus Nitrosocosmicus sp.]|nr:hypothetical protein [Candidatus Nitrosocosmicus sp.]
MSNRLSSLYNDLGPKKPRNIVVNSILFSIISFLCLLTIGSFIQPTIYPLIDRVTYSTPLVDRYRYFIDNLADSILIFLCTILWFNFAIVRKKSYLLMIGYGIPVLISLIFDFEIIRQIIALISFPLIIMILLLDKYSKKSQVFFDWKLCINYLSISGFVIGVLGLIIVMISIIQPEIFLPSINFLYYISLILSILSPIYLLFILAAYPLNRLLFYLRNKIRQTIESKDSVKPIIDEQFLSLRTRIVSLSLIVFLSIGISLIPHLSTINFDNQPIGSDTNDYQRMLLPMLKSLTPTDLFYQAFLVQMGGDRPFSLLFFLTIPQILHSESLSISLDYLPVVLGPMLILTMYFLTLELTKNQITSILASLFTIPFHILIGIYGGLYANWFSLSFAYLSILFLFRGLNRPNVLNLFFFSTFLIVLLFCHTPTWTIFLYVIIIFIIVAFVKKIYERKRIVYMFLCILPSVFIDISKMILINTSGVLQEIGFATNKGVGVQDIGTIWNNLIDTTHLYMGGLVGNPILLLLVMYWIFKFDIREKYSVFLIIFFSISALPILFAEQEIQTRFYYEIPFQIPAAIALTIILRKHGTLFFSTMFVDDNPSNKGSLKFSFLYEMIRQFLCIIFNNKHLRL